MSATETILSEIRAECQREGFPDYAPAAFVEFFCRTHRGVKPDSEITRIEFTFEPESP